jgi:hypothetical protein
MATYYVSESGNDTWNGLASSWDGANGPKKTFLGGRTVSNLTGNTLFILPGVYVENIGGVTMDADVTALGHVVFRSPAFKTNNAFLPRLGATVTGIIFEQYSALTAGSSTITGNFTECVFSEMSLLTNQSNTFTYTRCKFFDVTTLVSTTNQKFINCTIKDCGGLYPTTRTGTVYSNCHFINSTIHTAQLAAASFDAISIWSYNTWDGTKYNNSYDPATFYNDANNTRKIGKNDSIVHGKYPDIDNNFVGIDPAETIFTFSITVGNSSGIAAYSAGGPTLDIDSASGWAASGYVTAVAGDKSGRYDTVHYSSVGIGSGGGGSDRLYLSSAFLIYTPTTSDTAYEQQTVAVQNTNSQMDPFGPPGNNGYIYITGTVSSVSQSAETGIYQRLSSSTSLHLLARGLDGTTARAWDNNSRIQMNSVRLQNAGKFGVGTGAIGKQFAISSIANSAAWSSSASVVDLTLNAGKYEISNTENYGTLESKDIVPAGGKLVQVSISEIAAVTNSYLKRLSTAYAEGNDSFESANFVSFASGAGGEDIGQVFKTRQAFSVTHVEAVLSRSTAFGGGDTLKARIIDLEPGSNNGVETHDTTSVAAATNKINCTTLVQGGVDAYKGWLVRINEGIEKGEVRLVSGFASNILTVASPGFLSNIASGVEFTVFGGGRDGLTVVASSEAFDLTQLSFASLVTSKSFLHSLTI